MADAVIVDDGGSTRIKRLISGVGEMDSLLNVDDFGPPAGRRGSSHEISKVYTRVQLVCQDETGDPFSQTFAPFTRVEISSALGQRVTVEKNGAGKLKISVFSDNGEPIVEAKQHEKKRRYIVTNSGPIETVRIDSTLVYDVPNGLLIGTAAGAIIYSSVVIT